MQDLSAKYAISLTPSSQEGGNLQQPDLAQATMTAPGSVPVTPLPPPVQGSHPQMQSSGPRIPLSTQKQPGKSLYGGAASWQETPDPDDQPRPSAMWKQL